ncbi:5267_t:CDS:10 [Paraglomus occultum]|uniref:Mediator of RNA polymerase II transcription subunit 14 n=1 Tax=Paraglomus occultum TaxID=144539 RepID=A0A9N8VCK5_9GLOM|nr:5267_t:CDS:10 [Paraglomus occultum]
MSQPQKTNNHPETKPPPTSKPIQWVKLKNVVGNTNAATHEALWKLINKTLPQIEGKEAEIRKAYAKKVRKEELPSDVLNADLLAAEKRKALIGFACQTRELCLRSLAAVKFAQHADKIRQAENQHQAIQHQSKVFSEMCRSLEEFAMFVPATSVRQFDLLTGIDILTSGSYLRFPKWIKETLAPEPIDDAEVQEVLQKLNNTIQVRLMTEEVVPPAMKTYRVHDGRVTFVVPDEFQVSLTLGPEKDSHWHVVDVKIFVQNARDKFLGESDLSFHEHQLGYIREQAQMLLNPYPQMFIEKTSQVAPKPPKTSKDPLPDVKKRLAASRFVRRESRESDEGPSAEAVGGRQGQAGQLQSSQLSRETSNISQTESSPTAKFIPLVHLYEYLHGLALDLQLDVMWQQSKHLMRTRYYDHLAVNMNEERTVLRLHYWRGGSSANVGTSSRYISGIGRSALSSTAHSKRNLQHNPHNVIEISIVQDTPKEALVRATHRSLSRTTWANDTSLIKPGTINGGRGLNYPNKRFQVGWCGFFGEEKPTWRFLNWKFNPRNVNIEHLLLHVGRTQADMLIRRFYDALTSTYEKNTFAEGDVELVEGRDVFRTNKPKNTSSTDITAKKLFKTPTLRIRFGKGRFVNVSIDIRTGLLLFEEASKGIGKAMTRRYEEAIANNFSGIVNLLINWKFKTLVEQIEKTAKFLELEVKRDIRLSPDDCSRFGTTNPLFLGFPQNTYGDISEFQKDQYYLVAGFSDGKMKYWIVQLSHHEDAPDPLFRPNKDVNGDVRLGTGKRKMGDKDELDIQKRRPVKRQRFDDEGVVRVQGSCEGLEMDLFGISRAAALCRVRICHIELERRLNDKSIKFESRSVKDLKDLTLDANMTNSISVPVLHIKIQELLKKIDKATDRVLMVMGDIYIRPVGWLNSSASAKSSVLFQCPIHRSSLPDIGRIWSKHIEYDPITSTLVFRYDKVELSIERFLQDWKRVVLITQIASQVSSKEWHRKHKVSVYPYDFKSLKIQYAKDFYVKISGKVSGKTAGYYRLQLGITGCRVDGPHPHRRVLYYLETRFNSTYSIDELISTLTNTAELATVLDEIERNAIRLGKKININHMSANHYHVLYHGASKPPQSVEFFFKPNNNVYISDALSVDSSSRKVLPLGKGLTMNSSEAAKFMRQAHERITVNLWSS